MHFNELFMPLTPYIVVCVNSGAKNMKRSSKEIKEAVREHYAAAISGKSSCCGSSGENFDPEAAARFARMAGYSGTELADLPETVTSFGCGNPTNALGIKEGQTVLDLGSGAGLDMILASKKVGPEGRVIGLDMTPEMIETCRRNLSAAGVTNAEVRKGEMEHMPVGDCEIDWIISNCVINLSPEKEKVFSESYRVLKPGGQMSISDIVTLDLPEEYRDDIQAWVGCIAGAVDERDYIRMMESSGFIDVRVVDKLVYDSGSLAELANDACGCGPDSDSTCSVDAETIDKYAGRVASVKISARRPV